MVFQLTPLREAVRATARRDRSKARQMVNCGVSAVASSTRAVATLIRRDFASPSRSPLVVPVETVLVDTPLVELVETPLVELVETEVSTGSTDRVSRAARTS